MSYDRIVGNFRYAWWAFIFLAFVLSLVTLFTGGFFEGMGEPTRAGGAFAFSAAFVSLAVTFASTSPGSTWTGVVPILLAFAIVFIFGFASEWGLSGLELGLLLIGLGMAQAVVTRFLLPSVQPEPVSDAAQSSEVMDLQRRQVEMQKSLDKALEDLDVEERRGELAQARVAELEAALSASLPRQLLRMLRAEGVVRGRAGC